MVGCVKAMNAQVKMRNKFPDEKINRSNAKIPEFGNTIILGPPRSGKTLLMVAMAFDYYKEGYNVKSVTMETVFSETIPPTRLIDFDVYDCILLIDEIYTILDSRKSMGVNSDMSYFFFQAGKNNVRIICTAQVLRTIDCRIADSNMVSEIINARKIMDENDNPVKFVYSVQDAEGEYSFTLMADDVKKSIYSLYDTKQIIMPLYVSGKNICDMDDIVAIYEECPTTRDGSPSRKVFSNEVKMINPYVTGEMINSCYDWLKAGKIDKAKRALNL